MRVKEKVEGPAMGPGLQHFSKKPGLMKKIWQKELRYNKKATALKTMQKVLLIGRLFRPVRQPDGKKGPGSGF